MIKFDCETQLTEAIPILESAVKAVSAQNKDDITEAKAMQQPPEGVKLTIDTW